MERFELQYLDVRGTITQVHYRFHDQYGTEFDKYANVYLPHGYAEETEKTYNVLYLMHGGCGSPDTWLDWSGVKNMLDFSFAEKKCEPFIAVFPQLYYPSASEMRAEMITEDWEYQVPKVFQTELREKLVPLIDETFRTTANRSGRAFGGFSLGSATTWSVIVNNVDLFRTYLPLSGDCWDLQPMGGFMKTKETVDLLVNAITEKGYGKNDLKIISGTGTVDLAARGLTAQIEEMKSRTDLFEFSEDSAKGNLCFNILEGGDHNYADVLHHIYNAIGQIF